jgi:hypothetical protein
MAGHRPNARDGLRCESAAELACSPLCELIDLGLPPAELERLARVDKLLRAAATNVSGQQAS